MSTPQPAPVPHRIEPFWDAQLAMAAVLVLYALLPERLSLGPRWAVPALCGVALGVLAWSTPWSPSSPPAHDGRRRRLAIGVIGMLAAVNFAALVEFVVDLVDVSGVSGRTLLGAAATLWLATVLVFGVLYWEIDRGGPVTRSDPGAVRTAMPDFFFVQMDDGAPAPQGWMPGFVDYLYLSFTNSMAFSPTDTMPFTHRAKLLMALQSLTSFVTVALVAARAVNILH